LPVLLPYLILALSKRRPKFRCNFKNGGEKMAESITRIETDDVAEMDYDETGLESVEVELPISQDTEVLQARILKEIRSWRNGLLMLGAISIFASGFLSAPWGVLLILVGLASFYFRSSAMLVIYAVTLAWASVGNLISGQVLWISFAIFQWFLAFRVFQRFFSFRRDEAALNEEIPDSSGLTPKRTAEIFPWAGGILGAFSVLGFVSIIVVDLFLMIVYGYHTLPRFMTFAERLVVNLGGLAFATGLASVLCKYPKKPVAIAGMVAGVLPLLTELILKFK
jgi:hypothetical protein